MIFRSDSHSSLALKDVHLALEAAGDDRFRALACLADEWQQVVDHGLGDRDLVTVARPVWHLEQREGDLRIRFVTRSKMEQQRHDQLPSQPKIVTGP